MEGNTHSCGEIYDTSREKRSPITLPRSKGAPHFFTNCKHSDDKKPSHVKETPVQVFVVVLGEGHNEDHELQAFRHRGGFGGKLALVPQGVRAPFCVQINSLLRQVS